MTSPTTATAQQGDLFCLTADGLEIRLAPDVFGGDSLYWLVTGTNRLCAWIPLETTELLHPEDCSTPERLRASFGRLSAAVLQQRREDIQRATFIARQRERGLPLWPRLADSFPPVQLRKAESTTTASPEAIERARAVLHPGATPTVAELLGALDELPIDGATARAVLGWEAQP